MAAALPADAPYHAPASYHPAPAPYHPAPAQYEKEQPQPYQYRYGVADEYAGTNFEKAEEQDGYGNVAGSYTVNLPDGRQQIVTYTADHENGKKKESFISHSSQYTFPISLPL